MKIRAQFTTVDGEGHGFIDFDDQTDIAAAVLGMVVRTGEFPEATFELSDGELVKTHRMENIRTIVLTLRGNE